MNQKKAKQRQAYDYLYYVIRAAVLLSVVFLFIPSLNPARISGMINKNLSLFTSGISYSTLTNGFGRAFKKGWVSQESFMLDCARRNRYVCRHCIRRSSSLYVTRKYTLKEAWKYFFFDKRCGDDSWYRDDFYCIQTDKRQ